MADESKDKLTTEHIVFDDDKMLYSIKQQPKMQLEEDPLLEDKEKGESEGEEDREDEQELNKKTEQIDQILEQEQKKLEKINEMVKPAEISEQTNEVL